MNSLYNHYIIDLSSNNNFVQNPTMQGDGNGVRGIEIELIANNTSYSIDAENTIVSIMGSKPDTKHIVNECTVSDEGYILVDVTSQMSAIKGRGDYCIVLMDKNTNSQLKSFPFYILTTSAPFNISEIISSDEFQLLTKQIIETDRVTEEMRELEETVSTNESNRVKAENNRVSAEKSRVSADTERKNNENTRKTNETARIEAENTRTQNEESRQTEEAKRVSSETARVNAEKARVTAENNRVKAETTRTTTFNNFMEEANDELERLQEQNDSATASAELAKQYADNAKTSADTATSKASAASSSAIKAKTSETNAKTSETNSKNYADLSKSYAIGTDGETRTGDATDNAKYYYEQAKDISAGLGGTLLPMGTVAFANLSKQTKQAGYMYNISDAFTTTSDFKEGKGYKYPPGTNVYYTADGKWDCLAGTMVTSVNNQKGDVILDYVSEVSSETEPTNQAVGDYWCYEY